jgi:NTE family protein
LGAGTIIAVDLQTNHAVLYAEEGDTEKRRLPSLIHVVMQSTMLSGRYHSQEYRNAADLYFNPPLRQISLIDWAKFDQIEEVGYRHAKAVIEEWRKRNEQGENDT